MDIHNLEEEQVEFIIDCITKAAVQTQERDELIAWITLQYIHQKKGEEWKEVVAKLK